MLSSLSTRLRRHACWVLHAKLYQASKKKKEKMTRINIKLISKNDINKRENKKIEKEFRHVCCHCVHLLVSRLDFSFSPPLVVDFDNHFN